MKHINNVRLTRWLAAMLLTAVAAGCGGGGAGRDTILGSGTVSLATILPGAACSVASGPTVPTVTASNPASGNQAATTSTSGVAGGGKLVTATFSLDMNPATINATSFTLTPAGGTALIPASVNYDAGTRVATLTTSSALQPNTEYTANIAPTAVSAGGIPIACSYAWTFRTATVAGASPAAVNFGLAAPFGIAATAGVTNTATAPNSLINGNAVLNPTATCNSVPVDNMGGFGLCNGSPPNINGIVITPIFPDTTTANAVLNDLRAAYLSITPPAGPPAAGSLGGGTPIAAPTTLGATTGSAAVTGQNVFFPGVYTSGTSILVSNDLTLDAQGDSDAVFVFQSASTVGSAAGAPSPGVRTRILLINGARASNVFWQAGTSATLGTNTVWQGNILAGADVTLNTGTTSCGRLFAGAFTDGAFVFDSNVVSVPGNVNAPAGCN